MNKNKTLLGGFALLAALLCLTSYSGSAPDGYTGATGSTCNNCHASFALNSGGGSVSVTGLPTGSYIPGNSYPLSITINHGTADRLRWGFALAARNSAGAAVGSFTSTNANVEEIIVAEVGHVNAVVTSASASYTYNNFSWVAPSMPGMNDLTLSFYSVGNAANNNGGTSGDYIHTSVITRTFTLPVVLTKFAGREGENATVALEWETAQEENSDVFEIERSTDGKNYTSIGSVPAAGNSRLPLAYQYSDKNPPVNVKPLYRLKQIDKDGSVIYSNAVAVTIRSWVSTMERPAPNVLTRGEAVNVRFNAKTPTSLQVIVTDATGRQVYVATQETETGDNTIHLPASAFSQNSGLYYLTVQSGTGSFLQTERLLVL